MLTATKDVILPATVTGSWPRPDWYTENLAGRAFSDGMADLRFREQFLDATTTVVSDQLYAGLDVITNGDYHLDADFAGRSWFLYPVERLSGVDQRALEPTSRWVPRAAGSWLYEIVSGWRYPSVVERVGAGLPLEFAKIWRIAQARSDKPVKFGTISADLAAAALHVREGVYPDDKRQLMWDMATVLNAELRELAAAGCKVIQIEETAIHSLPPGTSQETLDFHVDLYHHQIEGLDGVEIWIHTCWGNPGAQRVIDSSYSYEATMDIYLNRMRADVWTIESKDAGHAPLALFAPYKGKLTKKVAAGFVSHRTLQVETPDEIAADVRLALEYIDAEHLVLSSDCGFGRQGVPRPVAFYKAAALARGANIVRRELGVPETVVPVADPDLQIDVLARPAS